MCLINGNFKISEVLLLFINTVSVYFYLFQHVSLPLICIPFSSFLIKFLLFIYTFHLCTRTIFITVLAIRRMLCIPSLFTLPQRNIIFTWYFPGFCHSCSPLIASVLEIVNRFQDFLNFHCIRNLFCNLFHSTIGKRRLV